MKDTHERRIFSRISFDAETYLCQGDKRWPVELIDISLNGVLVALPKTWDGDPTKDTTVYIHLGGDIAINMITRLTHQQDGRAGFQCDHIDLESISHLRRLVELNLGDTDMLERELQQLA
ncbi:MAG: hypothetical protein RL336_693 [Pseudomonadota bacterium]|jgi:hypothetical protein